MRPAIGGLPAGCGTRPTWCGSKCRASRRRWMRLSMRFATRRRRRPASMRSKSKRFAHRRGRRPFRFVMSEGTSAPRPTIPADLATCDECLAEIRDPVAAALQLSVHELHPLRPAVVDHRAVALRPAADFDGRLCDVPRVPGRVRQSGRPAFSRPADRLPALRADAATARPRGPRNGRRPSGLGRRRCNCCWPARSWP